MVGDLVFVVRRVSLQSFYKSPRVEYHPVGVVRILSGDDPPPETLSVCWHVMKFIFVYIDVALPYL